jgi:molecular chaperone HtpG
MTDNVDEFAIKYLGAYDQKEFKNVTGGDTGIENEADTVSEEDKPILEFVKLALGGEVFDVKLSKKLGKHPVCLSSEGEVSIEMEKVFRSMPANDANNPNVQAKKILEINAEHEIYSKIKNLYAENQDELKEVALVLLNEAKLAEGLPIDDPSTFIELVTKFLSK